MKHAAAMELWNYCDRFFLQYQMHLGAPKNNLLLTFKQVSVTWLKVDTGHHRTKLKNSTREIKGHSYALSRLEICIQGPLSQYTAQWKAGPHGLCNVSPCRLWIFYFHFGIPFHFGIFTHRILNMEYWKHWRFHTIKGHWKFPKRKRSGSVLMEKAHVDNGERNSSQSSQEFENVTGTHPTKTKFQMQLKKNPTIIQPILFRKINTV